MLYFVWRVFAEHHGKYSLSQSSRRIGSILTTVYKDILLPAVAVQVAVDYDVTFLH